MVHPVCPHCLGRYHVRRGGVWVRCVCLGALLAKTYVKPAISVLDVHPHPQASPWPLPPRSFVAGGDFTTFRHRTWQTLLALEPTGLLYDCLLTSRIVDIQLSREDGAVDGYTGRRQLVELGLLIVVHDAVINGRFTGTTMALLLDERAQEGKPTWMFSRLTGNLLRASLGDHPAALRWFEPMTMLEALGDSRDDAAVSAPHGSHRPAGSGEGLPQNVPAGGKPHYR